MKIDPIEEILEYLTYFKDVRTKQLEFDKSKNDLYGEGFLYSIPYGEGFLSAIDLCIKKVESLKGVAERGDG